MKKIFFFVIIIFSLVTTSSLTKTVYLDVQFIIDNSDLGIFYKNKIQKIHNKAKSELSNEEQIIKKKETEINNKKNILKKEEVNKKVDEINKLLRKYQSNRQKLNNNIINDKKKYSNKILKVLNPLLTSYVEKNEITLVIEKKNILIGIKTLDITKEILDIFNNETKIQNLINND